MPPDRLQSNKVLPMKQAIFALLVLSVEEHPQCQGFFLFGLTPIVLSLRKMWNREKKDQPSELLKVGSSDDCAA